MCAWWTAMAWLCGAASGNYGARSITTKQPTGCGIRTRSRPTVPGARSTATLAAFAASTPRSHTPKPLNSPPYRPHDTPLAVTHHCADARLTPRPESLRRPLVDGSGDSLGCLGPQRPTRSLYGAAATGL